MYWHKTCRNVKIGDARNCRLCRGSLEARLLGVHLYRLLPLRLEFRYGGCLQRCTWKAWVLTAARELPCIIVSYRWGLSHRHGAWASSGLEVSSAMVTHRVSVPVFSAPRGLCSMFLKSFFLGAADYGIRILPATFSFSLTARKTYWGKLWYPTRWSEEPDKVHFMKLAFSVWPTHISHLDNF